PSTAIPCHRCPPARSGHRCVADNSNLYVFGGYNPDYDESGGSENEDYPLFRELWRYNFATDTWHQMGTEGYMPRELASMSLCLHGNNLLVFGGTGIPFGESNGNDVHVCNVKYKRWALLSCRGKKPNRIYGQAMAIINGCLYVFGGTTGYIYSTDLHKLDLNTREWIQLKPNNMSCDMPEERYRHEIAHDGQRIYILGGGTSWTAYSLDKIHAYNLETNTWEEITTKPHEKIGDSGRFPWNLTAAFHPATFETLQNKIPARFFLPWRGIRNLKQLLKITAFLPDIAGKQEMLPASFSRGILQPLG
uniref:Kelch domain-containing protein 10 n=1 Tax=Malurus cyaneus samueli TaxID=2593467 RepID=A0A8C5X8I2_9PASS